jgi:hypothetical protein
MGDGTLKIHGEETAQEIVQFPMVQQSLNQPFVVFHGTFNWTTLVLHYRIWHGNTWGGNFM